MKLFGKKALPAAAGAFVVETPQQYLKTFDSVTSYDDVYESNAAVRTCVDWLARQTARYQPETIMSDATGETVLGRNDAATSLLNFPAEGVSRFDLIRAWVSSLALSGNSFSVLIRDGERIAAIKPVPASRVLLEGSFPMQGDAVAGYIVNMPDGTQRHIPAEDMFVVKLWSPRDMRLGVSPLKSLASLIAEDEAASMDRRRFWQSGARPSLIVERPLDAPEWSDRGRKRFSEDFKNVTRGENTFGALVLEDGMTTGQVMNRISPSDSAFVEGRTQILTAVASALGIPPQAVGAVTENIRASGELTAFHLAPWVECLESAINAQLTPQLYGANAVNGRIRVRLAQPASIADLGNTLSEAVRSGWVTPRDARSLVGLRPLDGSDVLYPPPGTKSEPPPLPPNFNMEAPVVNIEPPAVNVSTHLPPPRATKQKRTPVRRESDGRIESVLVEDLD